ncbi:MAG TPA: bacillithiol system redox-active protein YtxJ [Balneolaceae bacterium]|nr:bacillithiol system redox-active protein YtxJ [Balneolaceae bacterium]|tara:strand:- start:111 stop:524 length:414 start_codon:yes stop_codon:yes gene_type:complete
MGGAIFKLNFISNLINTMTSRAEIEQIWNTITGIEDFHSILEKSENKPQLIYKHSPSCGVSFMAKQELDSSLEELSKRADLYIIDVIQDRPVSNVVAKELGIRHESPQVILLVEKKVNWDGSHWQVKVEELLSVLQE